MGSNNWSCQSSSRLAGKKRADCVAVKGASGLMMRQCLKRCMPNPCPSRLPRACTWPWLRFSSAGAPPGAIPTPSMAPAQQTLATPAPATPCPCCRSSTLSCSMSASIRTQGARLAWLGPPPVTETTPTTSAQAGLQLVSKGRLGSLPLRADCSALACSHPACQTASLLLQPLLCWGPHLPVCLLALCLPACPACLPHHLPAGICSTWTASQPPAAWPPC